MGQSIRPIYNPDGPLMNLRMVLTCDLCGGHVTETFEGADYIVLRSNATKGGWARITGGMWRGPCCKNHGSEGGE
jgi:hypothetical protein